jgi:hypothetical protein
MTSEITLAAITFGKRFKFTTAGYEKLAVQTANREKAGSRLATLRRLSTVSEQNVATFSGAGKT